MPPRTPIEVRLARFRHIDPETGCWLWTGGLYKTGYGHMNISQGGHSRSSRVHRVSYEHYVQPIPAGLEIDHLCRVRSCFNPDHLEVVTRTENVRRAVPHQPVRTHCANGHEFTPENTIVRVRPDRNPSRACRICACAHSAKTYWKQKADRNAA